MGVLHELQVAGIFKPVDEAEDHDHAGGDHAQEQHQAIQDHQPVHIQAHEDRQGGQGGAAGDGGEVAAPGGEHQHGQAQAQDVEEKHAAHAPGAVLLGFQHGAAGENAGDGDPLEGGIVDAVEEGLGYVGEAVGLEAGFQGVEEVHAPHEAIEVDDQRQGQDGETHVAGAHPDQVRPEDGQEQDHNADDQSAQVVVDAQILLQGAGGTGDAGGNHHEDHDVVEDIKGQVQLVIGMIQGGEQVLVALAAPGVPQQLGLPGGEGQQDHGKQGTENAYPAQGDEIGVGLVAGGEAAAGVGSKCGKADAQGGCPGGFGLGVHSVFLLFHFLFFAFPWGKVPPRRRMRGGSWSDLESPHTRHAFGVPPSPGRGLLDVIYVLPDRPCRRRWHPA